MSVGSDLTLRVFGQLFLLPDQRGRRRPLPGADLKLTALELTQNGLRRIAAATNPIEVTTNGLGRFDHRTDWGTIGTNAAGARVVQALPEPEAFEVEVTDPVSGTIQMAGQVFSNGDDMAIDSHIAPDERPLATALGRSFTEVAELAGFLAGGLAAPDKLGQVTLSRPYLDPRDSRHPTAPEKLFRHFGTLLDRLQAVHLEYRRRAAGFDPHNFDLMVPLGFAPLEKQIVSTLYWHPNLSAAERVAKMVASYAGSDVTEEVLRRNVSRLVTMLGKILMMPIEYQRNSYLWEDMAVILTLFTGIGLVAQRNHIVWADVQNQAEGRELILSTL
jgi:hypothetical protein